MKRLMAAVWLATIALVATPAILFGESYWEGNAARIREGEITEPGLLAASNTFPRGTLIRVTNRANGKSELLTVAKRIDRPSSVMLLVSAEAAQKLGIGVDEIASVRISVASEQGLPVDTEVNETANSRDPDVNPSVGIPLAAAKPAASAQPSVASAAAAAATEPQAAPQTAATAQVAPASEQPAAETPKTAEPSQALQATQPAAEPQVAAVTPTAEAPRQPQPAATTPEAHPAAAAAAEQPATESASPEQPAKLPATTALQDTDFLARLESRSPEKRVYAPARGADAPPPVFADEKPVVSAEVSAPAAVPTLAAAEAQGAIDRPLLASEAPAGAEPPTGPMEAPVGPFVQVERPDASVAQLAAEPPAPEAPALTGAGPAAATAVAATPEIAPAEAVPTEPPSAEPPFVQTEQPRAEVAALPAAAPAPTPPAERAGEQAVATSQPVGPDAASIQPQAQEPPRERPFVQTEQPSASIAAGAGEPAAATPEPPPERQVESEVAFVQRERPDASTTTTTLAPAAPSVPPAKEAPPVQEAPVERGFVQNEQPYAPAIAARAPEQALPAAPAEAGAAPQNAFVQAEQPLAMREPAGVGEAPPPSNLAAFVQTEPLESLRNPFAYDALSPKAPAARETALAMVQTEAPQPVGPTVAVETAVPSRETATEVMSMVDSPSGTPVEPALVEAALPTTAPAEEPARVGRIGSVGGEELLASLGSAEPKPEEASAAPAAGQPQPAEVAVAPTETVVTLEPTEPVPPSGTPTGTTPAPAAARPEPTAEAAAPAVAAAPAGSAKLSPAALLAAAVAREGLPLDAYYLQVAAVASEQIARQLVAKLGQKYPSCVIPPDEAARTVYRVLVGPLGADERGAVLSQFHMEGYRDAFIRYLN